MNLLIQWRNCQLTVEFVKVSILKSIDFFSPHSSPRKLTLNKTNYTLERIYIILFDLNERFMAETEVKTEKCNAQKVLSNSQREEEKREGRGTEPVPPLSPSIMLYSQMFLQLWHIPQHLSTLLTLHISLQQLLLLIHLILQPLPSFQCLDHIIYI